MVSPPSAKESRRRVAQSEIVEARLRFIGVRSQFMFQIALWLTHKSKDRPADEVFMNVKTGADEIVSLKEI